MCRPEFSRIRLRISHVVRWGPSVCLTISPSRRSSNAPGWVKRASSKRKFIVNQELRYQTRPNLARYPENCSAEEAVENWDWLPTSWGADPLNRNIWGACPTFSTVSEALRRSRPWVPHRIEYDSISLISAILYDSAQFCYRRTDERDDFPYFVTSQPSEVSRSRIR